MAAWWQRTKAPAYIRKAPRGTVFTDLAPTEHVRLEKLRVALATKAGTAWTRSTGDLAVLAGLMADAQNIPAVEVVLGDVLESQLGLQWVVAMDEARSVPCLRDVATGLVLYPQGMLRDGDDVRQVMEAVRNTLRR
jgi:hypothetical protein